MTEAKHERLDAFMQVLGLPFELAMVGAAVFGLAKVEHISEQDEEEPCTKS